MATYGGQFTLTIHHPHPELTLTGLHAVTAFVPGGETDGETDVNIQCLMLNA